MNEHWSDVENWLDLVDHLWIGIVLIAVAAVPSFMAARNHKSIKKVQDQVVNGHKTPMRDDFDKMALNLNEMRHEITRDMHLIKSELTDIRSEIRSERQERLQLDTRFEDFRKDHGRREN